MSDQGATGPVRWSWRDGADPQLVHASGFPSQAEAESWLAEEWPELFDAEVGSVSLYQGDRLVYGPMPLDPGP